MVKHAVWSSFYLFHFHVVFEGERLHGHHFIERPNSNGTIPSSFYLFHRGPLYEGPMVPIRCGMNK